MTTHHPDLGPLDVPPHDFERLVPRRENEPAKSVAQVQLEERVAAAGVLARELDVREDRARSILEAALEDMEARSELVPPTAADFRRQAAKLRNQARSISEAIVELSSIAGEYDAVARGL